MNRHGELLDALEAELKAPKFRAISGDAAMVIVRANPACLTVEARTGGMDVRIEATPLDAASAPDARPRIVLKSSRGGSDYADFSADGLAMGVLGMLLAAPRPGQPGQ